jgi:hypothetical protein
MTELICPFCGFTASVEFVSGSEHQCDHCGTVFPIQSNHSLLESNATSEGSDSSASNAPSPSMPPTELHQSNSNDDSDGMESLVAGFGVVKVPTTRSLGLLGITLIGIWLTVEGGHNAVRLLPLIFGQPLQPYVESLFYPMLAQLAVGCFLIGCRDFLAQLIFSADESSERPELELRPILAFLMPLLGLGILVSAIIAGVTTESNLLRQFRQRFVPLSGGDISAFSEFVAIFTSQYAWPVRIQYIVRAVCGAGLMARFCCGVRSTKRQRVADGQLRTKL